MPRAKADKLLQREQEAAKLPPADSGRAGKPPLQAVVAAEKAASKAIQAEELEQTDPPPASVVPGGPVLMAIIDKLVVIGNALERLEGRLEDLSLKLLPESALETPQKPPDVAPGVSGGHSYKIASKASETLPGGSDGALDLAPMCCLSGCLRAADVKDFKGVTYCAECYDRFLDALNMDVHLTPIPEAITSYGRGLVGRLTTDHQKSKAAQVQKAIEDKHVKAASKPYQESTPEADDWESRSEVWNEEKAAGEEEDLDERDFMELLRGLGDMLYSMTSSPALKKGPPIPAVSVARSLVSQFTPLNEGEIMAYMEQQGFITATGHLVAQ